MNYISFITFVFASFIYQVAGCDNTNASESTPVSIAETTMQEKKPTTTFIFVRHAEKDLTVKGDPMLTEEGLERADDLARLLSDVPVTAIYSSDFFRTKQTAQATADAKGLPINIYNPRELSACANDIFRTHNGGVILVVGHSNSTPSFVNVILGEEKMKQIDEKHYDNIFFVEASALGDAEVLHLHYGK